MKQLNLLAEFDACEPQNAPNDGQDQNGNNGTVANGHEYIDLGLSVKWATCNVGATKPEEEGNFFAWGETAPKTTYKWSTYKYGSDEDELTKYCTNSIYGKYGKNGFIDNKTVLDPEDDAATVLWGGKWRMPTDEEWTELREKCTWTWTTRNGINGYKGTSKINGNSIFFPVGRWSWIDLDIEFDLGEYWSSSLCTDHSHYAWDVYLNSKEMDRYYKYRYEGNFIRPVIKID